MRKISILLLVITILFGCNKTETGCTNPKASNYNSEAEEDDGSCKIQYEGTYYIEESVFVNGVLTESKNYALTVSVIPGSDSVVFENMWDYDKTIKGTKTEFSFDIHEQAYDQNTTVSGFGTFDFGKITYETAYGDLRHFGKGSKN